MRGDVALGYSAMTGWMGGLRLPRLSWRADGLDALIFAAAALVMARKKFANFERSLGYGHMDQTALGLHY